MTTTSTTYGGEFSYTEVAEGVLGYISEDCNDDEREALFEALMGEIQDEVDERLPAGWWWQPHTSEFMYPVEGPEGPDPEEMTELFASAWEAVESRYDDIKAATLPVLAVNETIGRMPDGPMERIEAAERLINQARNAQERFARERRAAIFAATRLMSYEDLAGELGVSTAAINKAVSEHKRHLGVGQ